MRTFNLSELIEDNHTGSNPVITGLAVDSRQVKPGNIFFAVSGTQIDGSKFINEAINNGARVIIHESDIPALPNIITIKTSNARLLLSRAAAKFYQKQPQNIIAVTGTNGKSSVAHFYCQIWQILGKKAATIGTIGITGNVDINQSGIQLTTPDPLVIHKHLAELADNGAEYVSLEASSHGLNQYRLHSVHLKAAAFTNLSRDHLDYHPDMNDYLRAKLRLFTEVLPAGSYAILNADIPEFDYIKAECLKHDHKIIDYGKQAEHLRILNIESNINQQAIVFTYNNERYTVTTNLIGEFQAYNLLSALGLAIATGANQQDVIKSLSKIRAVHGRMERVHSLNKDYNIFVDYAHTPDALEKTLLTLKPLCQGRLVVLFGCGGNRDKGKRPQMGTVADNLADLVIITDDNPRNEDAATIRQEIIAACSNAIEIGGREQAIEYAVKILQPDDVLLIAGKGHETVQIIGNKQIEFDDVKIALHYASLSPVL